ncbi:hypothetical protein [Ancylobacter sp. FA202]|nr:hypothetical protein [Ancylobacter sp. FA202]
MLFLALELWPYLATALAIGLATGWWSGCAPKRARTLAPGTGKGA